MATLRLGDPERNSINDAFNRVLERASKNKPFPLKEDEIKNFGLSLLPHKAADAYKYLYENDRDLVRTVGYHPCFEIRSEPIDPSKSMERAVYSIELAGSGYIFPKNGLTVETTHPRYAEILAWADHYCEMDELVSKSLKTLYHVTASCSSAGQIKRVLQHEILRFLPENVSSSLAHAERRSRIPKDLNVSKEELETVANTLTIASLSCEEMVGVAATAARTFILSNKTGV